MCQLKKIDYLKNNLNKVIDNFICPICSSNITIINNSLRCEKNHTFDISNKGYFVFYKTSKVKNSKIYDTDLFVNRRNFINLGFYEELHNIISKIITL